MLEPIKLDMSPVTDELQRLRVENTDLHTRLATAEAERDAAREEVDRCKVVITDANNSLYGSQGFFLGMGGDFDPRHLSRPIENLKKQCRDEYAVAQSIRTDRDRLAACVERIRSAFYSTGTDEMEKLDLIENALKE